MERRILLGGISIRQDFFSSVFISLILMTLKTSTFILELVVSMTMLAFFLVFFAFCQYFPSQVHNIINVPIAPLWKVVQSEKNQKTKTGVVGSNVDQDLMQEVCFFIVHSSDS